MKRVGRKVSAFLRSLLALLLVCAPELAPSLPLPPASPQPRNSVKTGIRDKTRDHMR